MARLVLVHPATLPATWDLHGSGARIGRIDDNEIVVANRSLSRNHARISLAAGQWSVEDLGSKNGTFVNDRRVATAPLNSGDALRLGEVIFRFDGESVVPQIVREVERSFGSEELDQLLAGSRPAGSLRLSEQEAGERDRAKLSVLLRVSEVLSSPGDLETLLHRTLDLLFRILDVDRATIGLIDPNTGLLAPRVTRSSAVAGNSGVWSQTIVEYVRERQMAALFDDAPRDMRVAAAESIQIQSISASMCAPLRAHGRFLGVLYVDRRGAGPRLLPEDLDFLAAFANQAAIAVDNAALYKQLEEEAVERNVLLRFFPPSVVPRVRGSGGLSPVDADVTAMFCDLSDFTELASRLPPRQVVGLLNAYFPRVAEIVFQFDGTLEKYIGDALLAVWGAPFPHPDDADRALATAVAVRAAALGVRTPATPEGLRVHIGLHSGEAAAGNIGSARYLQYATIGDATNIASRVSNLAQGGEIVLSEATRARLRRPWEFETLPLLSVKGRREPLQLYRLIGQVPDEV